MKQGGKDNWFGFYQLEHQTDHLERHTNSLYLQTSKHPTFLSSFGSTNQIKCPHLHYENYYWNYFITLFIYQLGTNSN